jgi:hypothetical protein
MTFIDEIKNMDISDKKIREFGLFVGGILLAIGGLLLYKDKVAWVYFIVFGSFLFVGGLVCRPLLKPIYRIWMSFAFIMGFFMSKVILGFLFFLVVTPLSIIAKIKRTRLLDLDYNKEAETYWIKTEEKPQKETYHKQF